MNGQGELTSFTNRLAMFIRRNVPIDKTIDNISGDINNRELREAFQEVGKNVSSGKSFYESLKAAPSIYPQSIMLLIKTGEEQDKLAETLEDIAGYLREKEQFQSLVKTSFSRYLVPVNFTAVIFAVVFFFFTPIFYNIFMGMQLTMPLLFQWIILITDYFISPLSKILFFVLLLAVNLFLLLQNPLKSRFFYNFIPSRSLIRKYYFFTTLKSVSMMMKRGLSLETSLGEILRDADCEPFKKFIENMLVELEKGEKSQNEIVAGFQFPESLNEILIKEDGNKDIQNIFDNGAIFYRNDLQSIDNKVNKSLSNLYFAAIGIVILIIMTSLFSPLAPMYWIRF